MNILFLDSIDKQTYGGMEEWIRLTAGGLADRGHSVAIVGRPGSEFLRRVEQPDSGVGILPLEISGDFNPTTIARLRDYLAERDIDIIVVNFNKDVRLGGLSARLERRPKVVWSVGLDITKDSLVHRLLTPRLVDGVIVPSLSLKKQITRLKYIAEDIVEVIPIGIGDRPCCRPDEQARSLLRERYGWPPEAVVAVTVGRLVDQKGHRYLIEAIRTIIKDNRLARFIFVGDGPLRATLEALITQYELTEFIAITGMLDKFDPELDGADIMVHPSVEEPFGIAVLEGMRAGLPIVASRVGGIPEVVEEGTSALLVEPANPDDLAVAVSKMMNDNSQRTEMGQAGRFRWSRLFQFEVMIDHLENYLKLHYARQESRSG